MSAYHIKQNDTGPYIEVTLEDVNGPVNLSGAKKVLMHMKHIDGTPTIAGIVMTKVTDGTDGKFKHQWEPAAGETPAELAVAGEYNAEFEVYDVAERRTTFPEAGYSTIDVDLEIA